MYFVYYFSNFKNAIKYLDDHYNSNFKWVNVNGGCNFFVDASYRHPIYLLKTYIFQKHFTSMTRFKKSITFVLLCLLLEQV